MKRLLKRIIAYCDRIAKNYGLGEFKKMQMSKKEAIFYYERGYVLVDIVNSLTYFTTYKEHVFIAETYTFTSRFDPDRDNDIIVAE